MKNIYLIYILGFPSGSDGKESYAVWESWIQSLGWEDLLEKQMTTHSRILTWRIPRTKEIDLEGKKKSEHFFPEKKFFFWTCNVPFIQLPK